jgi:uncharacterized protein YdhG (YjbR/CyaY superfamily)
MPDSSLEAYEAFLATAPSPHQQMLRALVDSISAAFPQLERVIAWNKVHFRLGGDYVLGIDLLQKALWLHPFDEEAMTEFSKRLEGLHTTKRSFQLPIDDAPDFSVVRDMVAWSVARLPSSV